MQHATNAAPCPASPPDPQPDRPGSSMPGQTMPARTIPARIAALLHTVRILLGYGRHLAATAEPRSASTDFNAIASCFGTSRLYAILAHLQRGLLRAAALERVLLERAARGRDIGFPAPREQRGRGTARGADPLTAAPADPAAGPAGSRHANNRPRRPSRGSPRGAPARPAGTTPNCSCRPWRNLRRRCAVVRSAARWSRSASTWRWCPASAPARSGTSCSTASACTAAASPR